MSLRKAGFTVTTSESVKDALEKLELHQPDLIVSETTFADGDGFELRRRVRATPDWGDIPFIFLTAEQAIENKIRGLELGVDDYLTKPIYIKEIITRINILLQKRQRARFEERRDGRTRFAGRVSDMPVVDVIQTIEISRKSGVIQFLGERNKQATIYFRDGRVIDAEAGSLQGEDAVYRLLTWNDGEFEVVFRTVRRREVIQSSSQGLLMEGMRRLDEWSRILEQVPSLGHRFEIDTNELAVRLGEVPDDNNRILRLIDGKRTLLEVIDASDVGDLECLQAIARLYFEDILIDLDHSATERKRDTGRQMFVEIPDAPTPIEDAASGPVTAAQMNAVREASGPRPMPEPVTAPITAIDPSETQPTDLADVISEEDASLVPLSGGYRPSSLRLIDEAVAAAQAIEPSLFAGINDLDDAPIEPEPELDPGVPQPIETDEQSAPPPRPNPARVTVPKVPVVPLVPLGKDDSGLRMIGSLGRDRAEASGELRPSQVMAAVAMTAEPARELVTIMPRRITREIPLGPSNGEVVPPAAVAAVAATPIEPTPAPPVVAEPPMRASRELRDPARPDETMVLPVRRGPGPGAIALIALAVMLAIVAIILKSRKHAPEAPIGIPVVDARQIAMDASLPPPADAAPALANVDAAAALPPIDAAAPVDAPLAVVVDAGVAIAIDPVVQAKTLAEQARAALDESDDAKALMLADQSLKLRRTARTYMLKATALQRLGKVDLAIDAIDLAIDIYKRNDPGNTASQAGAWEQKGRVLWAANRKDEAKTALARSLELAPNQPHAAQLHKMIDE